MFVVDIVPFRWKARTQRLYQQHLYISCLCVCFIYSERAELPFSHDLKSGVLQKWRAQRYKYDSPLSACVGVKREEFRFENKAYSSDISAWLCCRCYYGRHWYFNADTTKPRPFSSSSYSLSLFSFLLSNWVRSAVSMCPFFFYRMCVFPSKEWF